MKKLTWAVALAVFALFFGVYSFRLGVRPELWHDDFEYTYPSYSLAERGNFGSPLLGPGLNIQNRTYDLIVTRRTTPPVPAPGASRRSRACGRGRAQRASAPRG
jgi:hypothetical protein